MTATFLPLGVVEVEVRNTTRRITFTYGTSVVSGPNGSGARTRARHEHVHDPSCLGCR